MSFHCSEKHQSRASESSKPLANATRNTVKETLIRRAAGVMGPHWESNCTNMKKVYHSSTEEDDEVHKHEADQQASEDEEGNWALDKAD